MSKKSKIFLAVVAVLTCLAGMASVFLMHYKEEQDKAAEEARTELISRLIIPVRRYETTLPMLRFTEENPPAFADVLDYFAYEGFYSPESFKKAGAQTPDLLKECLVSGTTYKVPAATVEALISERFGVQPDRDSVAKDNDSRPCEAYYDSESGCYVFDAACDILHKISIYECDETEPGVYQILICKDTALYGYPALPVYKEYTVAAAGDDFKILAVTDYKRTGGSAEPDDRKFKQIVSDYVTACDYEFKMGETVPYAEAFNYFMYEGCVNVDEGLLKPEMKAYLKEDGVLSVPASVADAFLAKRFRTEPDKKSVPCYNSDTDTYDFTPLSADNAHYYNIIDKTKMGGSTYVIYAVQKTYGDSTGFSDGFFRFVLQARKDEFKFLSAARLYDHAEDEGLYPVELEKNENYSIVEKSSKVFEYVIYTADGSVAERLTTGGTYPRVTSADGITSIRVSDNVKYYSRAEGKFSDTYTDVYAEKGSVIAHAKVQDGKVTICVIDVFDTENRKEIPFVREFSRTEIRNPSDCITSMEFTEEGDLKVVYTHGENYTLTEEVLELH